MAQTQAQKRATAKYNKAHAQMVSIKLLDTSDGDIIAQLDKQPSKQGYIKALIRNDIKNEKKMEETTMKFYSEYEQAPIYLKNYEHVANELADMLLQLDIAAAAGDHEDHDIYLYVDADGNGKLDDYLNVGGSSWRDDDHITLYTHRGQYTDMWEVLHVGAEDFAEVARICGTTPEALKDRVIKQYGLDADYEDPDDLDDAAAGSLMDYIRACPDAEDLATRALDWYADWLEHDADVNYDTLAAEILGQSNVHEAVEA